MPANLFWLLRVSQAMHKTHAMQGEIGFPNKTADYIMSMGDKYWRIFTFELWVL